MAYDPLNYRPRYDAIASAGAGIGAAITGMGLRKEAIEEAEKNFSSMEDAWKIARKTYKKHTQPLIEQGYMTEEERNRDLSTITAPKKGIDIGKYLDTVSKTISSLYSKINEIATRGGVTELMGEATTRQRGVPAITTPEQQPLPGATYYSGEFDAWEEEGGVTQPREAMREAAQQPAQQPQQPAQQPQQTQQQIYEQMKQRAAERGMQVPTQKQAEEYGLGLYPTEQDMAEQTKELTPHQQWRQQFEEKKLAAQNSMKTIATRLKKEAAEEKESKELFKLAMDTKEQAFKPLLEDAVAEKQKLEKRLNDKLMPPEEIEKERLKIDIAKLKNDINDYRKLIISNKPENIFKFLPAGTYGFEGSYPKRKTGGQSKVAGTRSEPEQVTKARTMIAQARELLKKGDFSTYSEEQLDQAIQNAQQVISQAGY